MIETVLNDWLAYVLLGAIAYNSLMVHTRLNEIERTIKQWESLVDDDTSDRNMLE